MIKQNINNQEEYGFILNEEKIELLSQLGLTEIQLASLIVILKNPPQIITKYQAGDEDDYPKYSDHFETYTATKITDGTYYTYQDMPVEVNIIFGTPKSEILRLLKHLVDTIERFHEEDDSKNYWQFIEMQRKIHNPNEIPGCMLTFSRDKECSDASTTTDHKLKQKPSPEPSPSDSNYF
ncbi:hypothetical protein Dalk_1307 [Desulfatibacillum aliphaticivorans]|uniref:Uncharacterized protein n=1 Tax=Desulfatibacillum aliphaticivorans TaxID=218208 RepID=B8F9R4_DESAL|nr:hypothetical protein [Desulfatibacillum aliphaticivorans]ACL03010.1 hypothetical protein Dalk_1307 [Desulfatibacillum aliphaticivorans]